MTIKNDEQWQLDQQFADDEYVNWQQHYAQRGQIEEQDLGDLAA